MGIDFEPLDMSEIAAESDRVNTNPEDNKKSEDNKYVQLPENEGYLLMRILPRKKGKPLYKACRIHSLRTDPLNDPEKKRRYYSPKELTVVDGRSRWVGDSIIDKFLRDLWKKVEKSSGQEQKDLKQQYRDTKSFERYYYNVVVRQMDAEGNIIGSTGPLIYSCGKNVHSMIMRAMNGDKKAGIKKLGDVTHPANGRDFRLVKKISKSPDGVFPNYDLSQFEEVSPMGTPEEMEKWMDNLHDLDAIKDVKPEDELKRALKIHLGLLEPDDGVTQDNYDPEEFSGAVIVTDHGPKSDDANGSDAPAVREELTQGADNLVEDAEAEADEEEVLVDDKFMEEMNEALDD